MPFAAKLSFDDAMSMPSAAPSAKLTDSPLNASEVPAAKMPSFTVIEAESPSIDGVEARQNVPGPSFTSSSPSVIVLRHVATASFVTYR